MIGVRDHLGFSMDGCMGQYLSKEDWSSNEGWTTWKQPREKMLKAKWSTKHWNTGSGNLQLVNFARQPNYSQVLIFFLPFPPIYVMPYCHNIFFIGISFPFSLFSLTVLHVPDINVCISTLQCYTSCFILPLILITVDLPLIVMLLTTLWQWMSLFENHRSSLSFKSNLSPSAPPYQTILEP